MYIYERRVRSNSTSSGILYLALFPPIGLMPLQNPFPYRCVSTPVILKNPLCLFCPLHCLSVSLYFFCQFLHFFVPMNT